MDSKWNHFYKKPFQKRLDLIAEEAGLTPDQLDLIKQQFSQPSGQVIENYVTDFGLPQGVAVGVVVNGHSHLVPMVTEEPSVIAAASNGSRLLAAGGGIQAEVASQLTGGQIIIKNGAFSQLDEFVTDHQAEMIEIANNSHPSILSYGGGAKRFSVRQLDSTFTSIDLMVDTGEAMGANMINTMLEALSNWLRDQMNAEITMAILTNYADEAVVHVSGKVPLAQLATQSMSGQVVGQRIVDASQVAQLDFRRATTHNKGIMNGVDAATIAFGNDWRAVESAVHSYAARTGAYKGLSTWQMSDKDLIGQMDLPVPIGFVGGANKVLPLVAINKQIAAIHNTQEEMALIAAVGLAQNLAALKALVTEGIQKGHMNLQLKSLALSNGAQDFELPQVIDQLRQLKNPDSRAVKQILKTIRR